MNRLCRLCRLIARCSTSKSLDDIGVALLHTDKCGTGSASVACRKQDRSFENRTIDATACWSSNEQAVAEGVERTSDINTGRASATFVSVKIYPLDTRCSDNRLAVFRSNLYGPLWTTVLVSLNSGNVQIQDDQTPARTWRFPRVHLLVLQADVFTHQRRLATCP